MADERAWTAAADALGDAEALALLAELVAIAPTNLEDPPTGRYEKPNYTRALERIERAARECGLATRRFDPTSGSPHAADLPGGPRPNLIVDLDVGATERVLVLAHYDVVPVPAEQLPRWKSPPHTLTLRDGRLYGRGSNDDLGSGVIASLIALKRLTSGPAPARNVRLLVCCDEETGGAGGIEPMKEHDLALPEGDPHRFIAGDVALIPDGSPHTTAGSSGALFLDATFDRAVGLPAILDLGEALAGLHERVKVWRSVYPSPDWPDHGAPDPKITGRATVTRFDARADGGPVHPGQLLLAHAETEAANQIAESVTLVFAPGPIPAASVLARARAAVAPPYRVEPAGASALTIPPDAVAVSVIGHSAHGGYPHRGHNPVPAALALLRQGMKGGWIDGTPALAATFAIDLRLPPEMPIADGLTPFLGWANGWVRSYGTPAHVEAPPARCRGGYALALDHPALRRFERVIGETMGVHGIFGEYGGTDASALGVMRTPRGEPLPAIVFGSMDRVANIHEAEESVDPAQIAAVARTIERFVREP